jgi:hypothetical protein
MKVFIICAREGLNYSLANEFGTPVIWLEEISAFNIKNIKESAQKLAASENFQAEDIILLSPGISSSMFCLFFGAYFFTSSDHGLPLNVLIFNPKTDRYELRKLNLSREENGYGN